MKNMKFAFCLGLILSVVVGCGSFKKGKLVVDINGTKITDADLEFLGKINPRIQAQITSPDGKKRIIDNIVEQELLYQDAVKKGVNRNADVKAKIDLYRRVIIAQELVDSEIEKAAKKYYDEHTDEFQKLKLSHIMIKYLNPEDMKKAKGQKAKAATPLRGEEEALKVANEVKARLDKGEEFASVAKAASEDVSTKNRGGDLGPASKGDKRFDARGFGALVDKAFEMKVGETAGPIKTNQGYHIIAVTQGAELESFDEAKMAIEFKMRNDVRNELLAKLKKDSKIKYPEEAKVVAEKKEDASEKPKEIAPPDIQTPAPSTLAKEVSPPPAPPPSAVKEAPAAEEKK